MKADRRIRYFAVARAPNVGPRVLPLDMLRYALAWPARERDAHRAADENNVADLWLATVAYNLAPDSTIAQRFASFGFRIVAGPQYESPFDTND